MNRCWVGFVRPATLLACGVALALATTLVPANLVQAAGASPAPSRYFAATQHTVSGRFLAAWQAGRADADSLRLDGLPLSEPHDEISLTDGKVYQVQWFERARFELHPEHAPPFDVERGLLGSFAAEGRTDPPFQPVANPRGGLTWFPQTGHTLGNTSTGGQLIAQFWRANGGLAQFGYPLSQPFLEASTETDPAVAGKVYLVQYFERQRLEYHPENAGTPFVVLLGRLGAGQQAQVATPEPVIARGPNSVDILHVAVANVLPETFIPTSFPFGTPYIMFNQLVYDDAQHGLHPDLALYVPTLENGGAYFAGSGDDRHLEVKFQLKHGVKWYDGQELTSADVRFTYQLNLDLGSALDGFPPEIADVEAPDPYTVVLRYYSWREAERLVAQDKDANAELVPFVERHLPVTWIAYNYPLAYILPAHVLAGMAPADIPGSAYAQQPWGTGPYYVTQNDPGKRIELAVNPNFSVTPNRPLIAHIIWDHAFAPADANRYLAHLDASQEDVVLPNLPMDSLPVVETLLLSGGYRRITVPTHSREQVQFNVQDAPFDDVRLRQAVTYGLDRAAMAHLLAPDLQPMRSWIPASSWASIDNPANQARYPLLAAQAPRYDYDPAHANQLLDTAGWTARAADGIRMRDGIRLSIRWITTDDRPFRRQIADLARQQLRAVGIAVVPDLLPRSVFFGNPDGPLWSGKYGDFGVAQDGTLNGGDDPNIGDYDSGYIPSAANNFDGTNVNFWSTPESDRLLRDSGVRLGRSGQRLEDLLHQQIIFLQELPALPLVATPYFVVVPARLQNADASSALGLLRIQDWYLPKH